MSDEQSTPEVSPCSSPARAGVTENVNDEPSNRDDTSEVSHTQSLNPRCDVTKLLGCENDHEHATHNNEHNSTSEPGHSTPVH